MEPPSQLDHLVFLYYLVSPLLSDKHAHSQSLEVSCDECFVTSLEDSEGVSNYLNQANPTKMTDFKILSAHKLEV